jgi:glycosyltransferase involved in cell wall biosynthesis
LIWRLLWLRSSIVHFYLPESYCLAGPIAVLLGIRTKLMSRRSQNAYHALKPPIFARLERWLHQRMTVISGNSERIIMELFSDEGVPRDKLILLRNGVTVSELPTDGRRAQIRTELLIEPSSVALVIVANLIPYKGHIDLLEALALLTVDRDWNVLVLGADAIGYRIVLERCAEVLGIADRTRFLGETADVGRVLDGCDIGVLCSHEEGFSNALLEYMERALPVVATAVGGNIEAVVDRGTGLLVPPKQPRDLAEALEKLIIDKELCHRLGAAGRDRAISLFGQDASMQAYARLYRSLLQGYGVSADFMPPDVPPNC